MIEFKIEYHPDYNNKYQVYRKNYKLFGFAHTWERLDWFDTIEKAEESLQEFKKFPKYYTF